MGQGTYCAVWLPGEDDCLFVLAGLLRVPCCAGMVIPEDMQGDCNLINRCFTSYNIYTGLCSKCRVHALNERAASQRMAMNAVYKLPSKEWGGAGTTEARKRCGPV